MNTRKENETIEQSHAIELSDETLLKVVGGNGGHGGYDYNHRGHDHDHGHDRGHGHNHDRRWYLHHHHGLFHGLI